MKLLFKNIKYILFDFDGTLLPMDIDTFLNGYLNSLSTRMSVLGMPKKTIIGIIIKGTEAMFRNDGSKTNKDAFWDTFNSLVNENKEEYLRLSDEYYKTEYNECKKYVGENNLALELVTLFKEKFEKVILATNPLFPYEAQKTRISWVGLNENNFDYITAYENSHYTKPNPKYYLEIIDKLGLNPNECLMIGNDVTEDMITCGKAGIKGLLVTDWIIDNNKWDGLRVTFNELLDFIKDYNVKE